MKTVPDGVFKPKATTGEKKNDATTKAAQQIIDAETEAREVKTERLRLARLAHEAAQPAVPVKAPRTRSKAKLN